MDEEPFFIVNEFLEKERVELQEVLDSLKGPKFDHYERSVFIRQFTNEMFRAYKNQIYRINKVAAEERNRLARLKLQKQKELLLEQLKSVEELKKYTEEGDKAKKDIVLSKVTNKTLVSSKFFDNKYQVIEPLLNVNDVKLLNEIKSKVNLDDNEGLKKLIESSCKVYNINFTDDYFDKIRYYLVRDLKKYGKVSPLLEDKNVKEVICNGTKQPLLVTYEGNSNVPTNVNLDSDTDINNLIKYFAQISKVEIKPDNPFLNFKFNNFEIQATLGNDFLKPKFVIVRS